MQNNFLTKISHEIRTPLNAIIGLGYLCQQTRLDDQQRKYVTTMIDSAKGLLDSFQEMLDFSKLENDEFEINYLPFSLDTVLNDIVSTIEPRCQEKSIRFYTKVDATIPPILEGDAMRISLILLNLAGNAVKFTEKGSVSIHVDKLEQDKINFSIIDTGIGISADMREAIFQPFTQVDNSHTRDYEGTGLGLAICALLTKRMQGEIKVDANPDGGSIFTVTLPLKEASELPVAQDGPLQGIRALVVEHNPLSQQIIESQLNSLGMKVQVAHEGELALRIIADADSAHKPFNIIILSLHLPDMGGVELAKYIQQSNLSQHPALILQSEFELDEIKKMSQDAGIAALLPLDTPTNKWKQSIVEILQEHNKALEDSNVQVGEEEEDSGPPRILLVEDNEINQEIAYEVLTTAHLEVDIANNGQEAVDAVAKQKYSLILMDVQMPVMDGLEATRRIREAGYTMPIIAMTAHAMLDDKEASMSAGMNAHLTKPLEPMALFATINSWLPSKTSNKKSSSSNKDIIAPRKGKLPDRIEGFNIIGGLATVGGNEELYANLLKKFANRYATVNEDISKCLQTNDIESAVRHAHTVRGIAANLGAEELAKAAENLEKTLIHSPSMTTPHLRTLVVCLTNAVNAISESLDVMQSDQTDVVTASIEERLNIAEREHARHVLDQAIINMESDWGYAIETIRHLSSRLKDTKLENHLVQLEQAVEDFEVETAGQLSKQIQSELSTN